MPQDTLKEPVGLRAARWLHKAQEDFDNKRTRSQVYSLDRPTIKQAADHFHCAQSTVCKYVNRIRNNNGFIPTPRPVGRPPALTTAEDEALVAYGISLARSGFPVARKVMEGASNNLRQRRTSPAPYVSRKWWRRWKRDHPALRFSFFKPVEAARKSLERRIEDMSGFFHKLEYALDSYNITASGISNADECGIRLGVLNGRQQLLC
jgi:hypothetical protein